MRSRVSRLMIIIGVVGMLLFSKTPFFAETIVNENEEHSVVQVSGKIGKQKPITITPEQNKNQQLVFEYSITENKQLPKLGSANNNVVWYGFALIMMTICILQFKVQRKL